jgi:hypothetical protein
MALAGHHVDFAVSIRERRVQFMGAWKSGGSKSKKLPVLSEGESGA